MKLSFWGAARQVTGSMFLLRLADGYTMLIDCGTDLANRHSAAEFPFNPSEIDLVLLSHAHIDHSGNLPLLINAGYQGQILCTAATLDLTQLLLKDSAAISTRRLKEKSERRKVLEGGEPGIFLEKQVDEAAESFVSINFNERFEITTGCHITFIPTGHLLGAANIFVEVEENGTRKSLLFSGDIGRKNYPILQDPATAPQADYLICETTYGNRVHQNDTQKAEEILEKVIMQACVETPGRLIIPAFSVGRSQSILYTLNKLAKAGKLPALKIFADSPMAAESSRIYEKYPSLLNTEAAEIFRKHESLFDFDNLVHVENFKESKMISNYHEPCIIISSSGMLTGGRMTYHIKKNINNPFCTILMVGYSAEGTPGHDLMQGTRTLKIKGKSIPVAANIIKTDVFSGHGDLHDLLEFVKSQKKLKRIFLVHGEEDSMKDFKDTLASEGFVDVELPEKGQSYIF
ncbi:MAG TPA: MBL fold metallo-hydrolase [Cytophagaceae bacterium]|jgi:metallo-beta-lactamase family protein|nr:MBL fold metallo-hydrolase [Cytophagaceae bacterium]